MTWDGSGSSLIQSSTGSKTSQTATVESKKSYRGILPAIYPNAGLTTSFRKKLDDLIAEMNDSYLYWITAKYKNNTPEVVELASDELPSSVLRRALKALGKRWEKKFADLAPKLADYFSEDVKDRNDAALKNMLRKYGISVKFQMSPAMRDIMKATISEQVGLIKSIPEQYHLAIEGKVMCAVAKGGDLKTLTDDLEKSYGITRRRAAFIARDQNSKATSTMYRARQLEIGVKEAIWLHSHGGNEPRPTHLANSGKRYDIAKGWFDPDANGKGKGEYIWPGQLINCRCTSRSIIPALDGKA